MIVSLWHIGTSEVLIPCTSQLSIHHRNLKTPMNDCQHCSRQWKPQSSAEQQSADLQTWTCRRLLQSPFVQPRVPLQGAMAMGQPQTRGLLLCQHALTFPRWSQWSLLDDDEN